MGARVFLLLRVALAAALLVWLVRELGGVNRLVASLAALEPWAVAAAFFVFTLDRALLTYKWLRLLRVRGQHLSLVTGMEIYCASTLWGMMLPATVGADSLRTVAAARRGAASREVLVSIVMERGLGMAANLALALVGVVALSAVAELPRGLAAAGWVFAGVLLGGIGVLGLSLSEQPLSWLERRLYRPLAGNRLVGLLERFHQSYGRYREHRGELAAFFVLTLVKQLMPALALGLLALGLGVSISPVILVAAVGIGTLVARVPISLGGIGVLEGAVVGILSLGAVPPDRALAASVASRVVQVASWIPWWLLSLSGARASQSSETTAPWPGGERVRPHRAGRGASAGAPADAPSRSTDSMSGSSSADSSSRQ